MSSPSVSIVVSTYNRPDTLTRVIAALASQSVPPCEVLVADDGSGPPTRDCIATWMSQTGFPLRHLWQPNDGFRKTILLNQAVSDATGDYLVFTDGDCVPHPRFVEDHQALAERGFWVQGRRCFVRERWVPSFDPARTPLLLWALLGRLTGVPKAFRFPWAVVRRDTAQRGIIGCNLAAWRDDLIAVNGFDEAYTGWGVGEDSDLGTRLYHLGRRRKFVYGRAIVYHLDHPAAPRSHLQESLARLDDTIRSGRIRCERGLNLHHPGSSNAPR